MRGSSRHVRNLCATIAVVAAAATGLSTVDRVSAEGAEASRMDRVTKAKAATRPARSRPVAIRDVNAAKRVRHSRWEPRPRNRKANHRVASKRALRHFRRWTGLPRRYKRRVTGGYRGTTDEIIQWAAYKWGFAPDLLRAVATLESWWRMGAVGDHGRSFGIMQIKRGAHCCFPLSRRSTSFNVDYYAASLRSIYDGRARWLNHEQRGRRYRRGDLWGSVGVWYSGRWHYNIGSYIRKVKRTLRKRVWRSRAFRYGG